MAEPTVESDGDLRGAAISYARLGWPVLPLYTWRNGRCTCGRADCPSPAKHPLRDLTPNGLKNATVDLDRIDDWWTRYPTANIGLRTGITFDVLDVDGDEGAAAMVALCQAHGPLPAGPWAETGGGGQHWLFAPTGIGNRAGIVNHVDWRGAGGYIVAPPSLHASGVNYRWLEGPEQPPPPDTPAWLRLILDPPRPARTPPPGQPRDVTYLAVPGQGSRYGIAALEAELDELARAQPGTRNNELNAHAFNLYQLVAGGELDEGFVDQHLQQVAHHIGLDDIEIKTTLDSARAAGKAQPRYAPQLPEASRPGKNNGTKVATTTADTGSPANPDEATEPQPDLDIDEFLNQPEPEYDWVIPGLIEHGDRILLTGQEGQGKSTLYRQIAVTSAAGIHPFTLTPIDPIRVLLIDLENSRRQVRRKIRPLRIAAGSDLQPGMLRILIKPDGIDLMEDAEATWLGQRLKTNQPDLVILGPLYRLHSGDPIEERPAKRAADILDHYRVLYGFALLIETHCPHPINGRIVERPYGASLWKRWPEFGLYLGSDGRLTHWRGARDERSWPVSLGRGGTWPWTPTTDPKAVTFARILDELGRAQRRLSVRELGIALAVDKGQIERSIRANRRQWDAALEQYPTDPEDPDQ